MKIINEFYEDYCRLDNWEQDRAKLMGNDMWEITGGVNYTPRHLHTTANKISAYALPQGFRFSLMCRLEDFNNEYFFWATTTLASGSGYKISFPTDTSMKFYRVDAGSATEIASATIDEIGDSVWFILTVERFPNGMICIEINDTRYISIDDETYISGFHGDVTTISDYSSTVPGTVKITAPNHRQATGKSITIAGTTDYNGTFIITKIDADNFYITETYTSSQTGTWTDVTSYYFGFNTASLKYVDIRYFHLYRLYADRREYARNIAGDSGMGTMTAPTLVMTDSFTIKLLYTLFPQSGYYFRFDTTLNTTYESVKVYLTTPDKTRGVYVEWYVDGANHKVRIMRIGSATPIATGSSTSLYFNSCIIHIDTDTSTPNIRVTNTAGSTTYVEGNAQNYLSRGMILWIEGVESGSTTLTINSIATVIDGQSLSDMNDFAVINSETNTAINKDRVANNYD